MASMKTKSLRRRVTNQKEYLKATELARAQKRKDTPTYAQWRTASPEKRALWKYKMNPNRVNRLMGKR